MHINCTVKNTRPGTVEVAGTRRRTLPHLLGAAALGLCHIAAPALGQGALENPQPQRSESGIGVVSGWHCNASVIEIQFDDLAPIDAAYGTTREDTSEVCGDADNGFGLLWAYALLGEGQHTVRAFADGVEFASRTFQVHLLGEGFIRGLELKTELSSLDLGKQFELSWEQSKQNFIVTHVQDLDYTLEDLVAALGGTWSGDWRSPTGMGSVSMAIGASMSGDIQVTDVTLTGTGCAANGAGTGGTIDINDPVVEVEMEDGSRIEFELFVTESFTTLGGAFWAASGPCAETDGMFYMFR